MKTTKARKKKLSASRVFLYIFLVVVCFFSAFPFFWMISAATNMSVEIVKGKVFFGTYLIENIKTLVSTVNIGRAFWNSLRNSVVGTIISIFICSMAGYGFQIYRDKGKDRLMSVLLLSMMVPFASIMVPLFRMFSQAGLLDTTTGFILPSISTAFLIFFFRQCSASFPYEIVQAARVDGLGEFGIYTRIFFPIMAPTFAAAAIVNFMNHWNNYIWPLIIMQSQKSQTMPLLTSGMIAGYTTDYGMLMVAVSIYTLPTMIIFITQQKRFVAGVLGAVK
jgi:lactose/L-arabinose transport system permease protein